MRRERRRTHVSLIRIFLAPSYTHFNPPSRHREQLGFSLEQYERR